jgi:hypothetical protein
MSIPESDVHELEATPSPADSEEVLEVLPRTVMSPQEVLERLRRGETVHNVRVERLRFHGEFPLPVKMWNVTLVRPQFDGAVFRSEVVFNRCTIDRPSFHRKTEFAGNLVLSESTLVKAHLTGLTVRGAWYCNRLCSEGRLLVSRSRFEGKVSFWEAHFRGWVDFKSCEFTGEADFRSLHAEEGFVLTRSRFAGDVLFRGALIAKKFEATGSRFEALLDLSKAKLHDYVYLEGIEQTPGQRFAFANALGERVLVRTEQLEGRLASEQKGDYAQAMHEYAFLKRAFGSLHRHDQEDWAYYRFKVNQRRCCNRSWLRPWTKLLQFLDWLLLDHGCGYCTNPFRAVRAAVLIMLGFGLIYAAGINEFHTDKLPFDGHKEDLLNRATLGLFTSVAVFTSGHSAIRDVARGWMNLPLIIESLLGTLLWGLFIVAFGRKVIR